MSMHRPQRERGATLIEAMVAILVVATAAAGYSASLIAAAKQDDINDGKAAAQLIANELAHHIQDWAFTDPKLDAVNDYTGDAFARPRVQNFYLVPASGGNPALVTESFDHVPDHNESELTDYVGRDIDRTNAEHPGSTFVFRRYWNVHYDLTDNSHLKVIAVHVTYRQNDSQRGVVTAFASVQDNAVFTLKLLE